MKPTLLLSLLLIATPAAAADWPQWGGSPMRNNAADAGPLPAQWNVGRFDADSGRLGPAVGAERPLGGPAGRVYTYGSPVIAGGCVFCGTNNGAGWLKGRPATIDAGCLLCFRRGDGAFQWQLTCGKLAAGDDFDFREVGLCSAPLVEGDRLWVVTNRCEVVCVDLGRSSRRQAGRRRLAAGHDWAVGGAAQHEQLLADRRRRPPPGHHRQRRRFQAPPRQHPRAPSFLAVDKRSGKVVWADGSPGQNILHGQWASPAFARIGGVPQAIFPGGDGWLYSFRLAAAEKPSLLWKFDCNPKRSVWKPEGEGDRGILVGAPTVHGDCVYIATGEDPEFSGAAQGRLWRIDARKRGDTSAELVFDKLGHPVPPRRIQAADAAAGNVVRPNPNSAAVWQYVGDQGPKAEFRTSCTAPSAWRRLRTTS